MKDELTKEYDRRRTYAIFSDAQVDAINYYQNCGYWRPDICGAPKCMEILVATKYGLHCKCGNFHKHWAYTYMVEFVPRYCKICKKEIDQPYFDECRACYVKPVIIPFRRKYGKR